MDIDSKSISLVHEGVTVTISSLEVLKGLMVDMVSAFQVIKSQNFAKISSNLPQYFVFQMTSFAQLELLYGRSIEGKKLANTLFSNTLLKIKEKLKEQVSLSKDTAFSFVFYNEQKNDLIYLEDQLEMVEEKQDPIDMSKILVPNSNFFQSVLSLEEEAISIGCVDSETMRESSNRLIEALLSSSGDSSDSTQFIKQGVIIVGLFSTLFVIYSLFTMDYGKDSLISARFILGQARRS